LQDQIGGRDLFGGESYSLINGFDGKKSAISLNNGYLEAPNGIYFGSSFTLIVWIKLIQINNSTILFDFGNEENLDSVLICISNSDVTVKVYNGSNNEDLKAPISLQLNELYHLTYVLTQSEGFIYINGIQIANGTQYTSRSVLRNSNYIGKNNSENDLNANANGNANVNANAIYQDIRIYQGAMNAKYILDDFFTVQISTNFKLIYRSYNYI